MKGLCNGTPFTVEKISPRAGLELGTARSVGQRLTTELPRLHEQFEWDLQCLLFSQLLFQISG